MKQRNNNTKQTQSHADPNLMTPKERLEVLRRAQKKLHKVAPHMLRELERSRNEKV